MLPVALSIVNDVSSVMWLNHDIHYAWQAQYLVRLEGVVAPRIANDVSYVMRTKHAVHIAWLAQYLVRLQGDACCSAQHDT